MGERKLRAKAFKQETDKAVEREIKEANLFSRKQVESDLTFECLREPEDAPVEVGNRVKLVDMRRRIDVFIGLKSVGHIVTAEVELVRERLSLGHRPGRSVPGRVIEVSELTPTFIVQVRPEDSE